MSTKTAGAAARALHPDLARTAAVMADVAAARSLCATAMGQNVPQCPRSRANRFSKLPPPTLPDDPDAETVVDSVGDVPTLSPAQRIAIGALVLGETIMSAARRAGVSRKTVYRWRQDPTFAQTLERLSTDTLEASLRRMRSLLLRSTHVLADALQGNDRHKWAMRMVGSRQVWTMSVRAPAAGDEPNETDDAIDPAPTGSLVPGSDEARSADDAGDRCGSD